MNKNNSLINNYLNIIQEAYLFSDDTISIDLDKFESGESNKLLIIGFSGSGKSTLGKYLSKKYNCKYEELDECYKEPVSEKNIQTDCILSILKNNKKSVVEGIGIIEVIDDLKNNKSINIYDFPVIILGKSSIKSAYYSVIRDISPFNMDNFKQVHELNFKLLPKLINQFKKERINKDSNVQKFIIPKI